MRHLHRLVQAQPRRLIGGKARGLQRLLTQGMEIPPTWVCLWSAHAAWRRGDRAVLAHLRDELQTVLRPGTLYAVRSSADMEDASTLSFAGRFRSTLRLHDPDSVLRAIEATWASAVQAPGERVRMAVLIQEMVPATASGIAFSRNPVTGADVVVIEAIGGTSEDLTRGAITPHRFVVSLPPPPESTLDGLPTSVIADVAERTRRLAGRVGFDADLEWAYDGRSLVWLQLRPITALPSPDLYSNRFAREYLPGLILPLVWSINVPMVNGAWLRLLSEVIGPTDIDPMRLAKRIGCRAYFNMGMMGELFAQAGLPRDVLEGIMGLNPVGTERRAPRLTLRMVRHVVRLPRFLWTKLRFSRHVAVWLPYAQARLRELEAIDPDSLDASESLQAIDATVEFVSDVAYHRIVTILRQAIFERLASRRLVHCGTPGDIAHRPVPDRRLAEFDPSSDLESLRVLFAQLSEPAQRAVRAGGSAALAATAELREFRESFDAFLRRFGHLCDSGNDFSSVPWREIPESVLTMATDAPRGPNLLNAAPAPPPRGVLRTLRRAAAARYDREAVGAVFTRGHMVLRGFVRTLGTCWFSAGVLPSADSVFFLSRRELADTAAGRLGPAELQRRITARQDEMERAKGLHLPDTVRGDEIPAPVDEEPPEHGLVGVAASRGIHIGPVRVVHGVDEFAKLQAGDVLVIPYSDVGWSPLLERASAIVAESGGLLSHAAIVAREAGIPAVVSVSGACRIPEGVVVRVDGNLGHVALTSPAPSQDAIV